MSILRFINIPWFFISFIVGIVFVNLSSPLVENVYVYPTPDNAGKIEYVDKVGNCFEYISNKVVCPKSGVKPIPIQE